MAKEVTIPKKKIRRFYVLYKGDNILSSGTIQEIQAKTGIPLNQLCWLTCQSAQKREHNNYSKSGKYDTMVMIDGGEVEDEPIRTA